MQENATKRPPLKYRLMAASLLDSGYSPDMAVAFIMAKADLESAPLMTWGPSGQLVVVELRHYAYGDMPKGAKRHDQTNNLQGLHRPKR